jgi:DNA-binding NtrC family response regulator
MSLNQEPIILVVDDEVSIADTTAEVLALFGYRTLKAYNAERALEIAIETPPVLLLTDVMMPKMNGVELAIKLQTLQPQCRVLLFSGQTGTGPILEDARTKGYDFSILSKPVHPTELVEEIKRRLSEEGLQID